VNETTPIDRAHSEMTRAPEDDRARLRFYERIADGELYLLLSSEAEGDRVTPAIFDLPEGRFVLAFDREERLARFAGDVAPYAALSGRTLTAMLADEALGLGLNLDVAPSAILLPGDAMGWLAKMLAERPEEISAEIEEVAAPAGLPESLIAALDAKLAMAAGMARIAYLVALRYRGGGRGHMLAFIDAPEPARTALAGATGETLVFSGLDAAALDVGFFAASDEISARLARVGLRFDLPEVVSAAPVPVAPGSAPEKPPRLR
jgi:hypothetical protein